MSKLLELQNIMKRSSATPDERKALADKVNELLIEQAGEADAYVQSIQGLQEEVALRAADRLAQEQLAHAATKGELMAVEGELRKLKSAFASKTTKEATKPAPVEDSSNE